MEERAMCIQFLLLHRATFIHHLPCSSYHHQNSKILCLDFQPKALISIFETQIITLQTPFIILSCLVSLVHFFPPY